MRLLLDKHILLWWLEKSPSLTREARDLIADPENTVFISAITYWELWLKHSLRKLRLPPEFEDAIADGSFEDLPLTAAHTREVANLPWHHRDPFTAC